MKKLTFKSLLLLCALIVGTNAWATDPTASFAPADFSGQGTSGTGSAISATNSTVTFACDKGYGTTQIRCYSGSKITISSSNTITAISFTFNGSYTGGMETSYTDLSTTSWTKTLSSQARITACTVTYTSAETRDPIATSVSISDPGSIKVGDEGTFVGVSTDAATCTKSWATSNSSIIEINSTTGAYNAVGRGTAKITYTITPEDDENYVEVYADRNVTVTTPVVITASDVEMTYGDVPTAIGATTSAGYTGTVSYTSENTNVATVDGSGNVTAVAAGATKIRISAGNNPANFYTASTKEINVTVNQIAGGSTAKPSTDVISLDFTDNSEWGFPTADYDASETEKSYSDGVYTIKLYGPSSKGYKFAGSYLIMGQSGAYLTLPAFSYPVTKIEVVGRSDASGSVKQNIFVGETAVSTETTSAKGTNTYEINSSYQAAGTIYTLKVTNAYNTQITAINVTIDKGEATVSVDLNADGYATFCSEYPLDFTNASGYTAWEVSSANTSTGVVTFSQVTGKIKGGEGILLKGTANAKVTIASANSSTILDDNMLVGCLAPTYLVGNDKMYVMVYNTTNSETEFQKLATGTNITFPANKAYLDLDLAPASAPERFRIAFEENNATNINSIEAVDEVVKFIQDGQLFIKRNGVVYDAMGRVIR